MLAARRLMMSEPQQRRMTAEEFFEWQARQDKNYELVDGVPVLPLKAMTGATRRHDRIVTNTLFALMRRLRGGPCWPTTDDIATRIPRGNVRRPDITVDCSSAADSRLEASEPTVLVEVLSPSTAGIDTIKKVEEYKTLLSARVLLLIDARTLNAGAWRRDGEEWNLESYEGREAVIPLPEIGAELPLAEVYEQVEIRHKVDPETGRPIPL
jgi:Uma2 family endonuclease